MLAAVAWFLVERNRDFLVGEEVSPERKDAVTAVLAVWPGVVDVRDLVMTFTGPSEVWVVARIDVEDGLTGAEVERLVVGIEESLIEQEEAITRVEWSRSARAGPGPDPSARRSPKLRP